MSILAFLFSSTGSYTYTVYCSIKYLYKYCVVLILHISHRRYTCINIMYYTHTQYTHAYTIHTRSHTIHFPTLCYTCKKHSLVTASVLSMSITANEKLDLRFNSRLKLSNDTIRISSDVLILPAIDSGEAADVLPVNSSNNNTCLMRT